MTTETEGVKKVDYWQCDGKAPRPLHSWIYRGASSQEYRCANCGLMVLKRDLKAATDG